MSRVLFLILVLMSSVVFAQKQKPQSYKFDEFKESQESDWKQQLDRFAEMQTGISNSTLYIIVYARKGTERTSNEKFKAEKIADFGVVNEGEFKNYFQEFDNKLREEPSATGYIINYGNAYEVSERERLIRDSIRFRNFDAMRLVIVNGGESKELKTVLWLVPYGSEPPTP